MGHKVLKHGNRSVSSSCGSADVLERLGVPVDIPPEAVPQVLEREGFVFLFAPRYHPAFRHVMPVRRELGVRTLFNILGPLVNPARPTHHFFGVPDPEQLPLLAATLARSSSGTGVVVSGAGGYDELTPLGEATLMFVENGETRPGRMTPAEYGFDWCVEEDLAVDGPEHAAETLRLLLQGQGPKPMLDMLALNLGMALYILDSAGHRGEILDPARGYNPPRMAAAMAAAEKSVVAGVGRRFCHA
jgi:anthranilate phosphoribosyltransferase